MSCANCKLNPNAALCPHILLGVDGTYITSRTGEAVFDPVDLQPLVEAAETDTRLQYDAVHKSLVYSGERALAGTGLPDNIPISLITQDITLGSLNDVSTITAKNADVLVYDTVQQKWKPRTIIEDTLVSIVGIGSDGQLVRQAVDTDTGSSSRVQSIVSTANLVPNPADFDQYSITAQNGGLNIASPGVSSDGKSLIIRVKDNGSIASITWNAIFRGIGVTLPSSTAANLVLYIGMKYNSQDSKWDVLAVARQS